MPLPSGFAGLDPPPQWPHSRSAPRPEALERPVESLKGVGPVVSKRLAKLGLRRIGDLLLYRPHRYESAVPEKRIADLFGSEEVAIAGEILSVSERRRGRLKILTARVADDSGTISATWFNQPWLTKQLSPGARIRLRGKPGKYGFDVRSYDLNGVTATADFAPVYPASEEVAPKKLRELVGEALELSRDLLDPLPAEVRERGSLPLKADALWALHRPRSQSEGERGRRALAFEELLVLQLGLLRQGRGEESAVAPDLAAPGELIERYRAALPFELTPDQERVIAEIDADLSAATPMQRLLQGEVGSGKTVVALYALLRAVEGGYQGALMAPTETLAEQHFLTVEEICRHLGVSVGLLTSSVPRGQRRTDASVLVGTHALIQKGVELQNLAVAVVDEQHRFGVEQRKALLEGRSPHTLHMTATPIPRTLALTVYGDLQVSEITKPPSGRKPVITAWVEEERSSDAYKRMRGHLEQGRQAYVICPLISESETIEARAAEQEADRLRRAELKGLRVGCLHGKLPPQERRELMQRFKAGELDVLVATTVIEVGVDVPNATIMVVQEADRFGLAQLHQLRGRVGRGAEQSYCLLVSRSKEELTDAAKARLEALVDTNDGFELAEADLELRGGGQLLGTRQSGLSDLHFTSLRSDRPLLERARKAAEGLLDYEGPLNDDVERFFADADVSA